MKAATFMLTLIALTTTACGATAQPSSDQSSLEQLIDSQAVVSQSLIDLIQEQLAHGSPLSAAAHEAAPEQLRQAHKDVAFARSLERQAKSEHMAQAKAAALVKLTEREERFAYVVTAVVRDDARAGLN